MNSYRYIAISIQDLASAELVHSVMGMDNMGDLEDGIDISKRPIKYYVNSSNMKELLEAKAIMEELTNNIYEVYTYTPEYDENDNQIGKKIPAYLSNIHYYNLKIIGKKEKNTWYKEAFKKLNKNRFQIIEEFTNDKPERIEVFDAEGYY